MSSDFPIYPSGEFPLERELPIRDKKETSMTDTATTPATAPPAKKPATRKPRNYTPPPEPAPTPTKRKRRTDAQLAVRRDLSRKRARYDAQEAKRAAPVQIDQKATMYLLEVLVAISFLSAAALLANATVDVASRMILAADWMNWLAFGAIEVAILVFMLGYLIVGSRFDEETGQIQSSVMWFRLMVFYSAITIGSSAFHTISSWDYDWTNPNMWAGTVLAVVIPLSYVLAVKLLSVVVFAKALRP